MPKHPRAALVVALCAGLAGVGLVPALADTSPDGALTLTAGRAVLGPGCRAHPVTWSVVAPEDRAWTLAVTAKAPSGGAGAAVVGADGRTSGTGPGSGSVRATLCAGTSPVGTYTASATLVATAADGGSEPVTSTTTETFAVVKAASAVTLKASPAKVLTGQAVTLSGTTRYLSGTSWRPLSGVRVTLRYRVSGSSTWTTLARTTSRSGAYKASVKWPLKRSATVQAVLSGTTFTNSDASPGAAVTRVAPPKPVTIVRYANCKALNAVHKHGVGRKGARDKTSGTPVTTFLVHTKLYEANTGRDRDKDGIACEKR